MKGKSKGLVQSRLDFNTGRTGPATEEVRSAVSLETPKDAGSSEAARSMLIPLTSAISLISPIQGYDKANQPDIMFPKTKKYNASMLRGRSSFRGSGSIRGSIMPQGTRSFASFAARHAISESGFLSTPRKTSSPSGTKIGPMRPSPSRPTRAASNTWTR